MQILSINLHRNGKHNCALYAGRAEDTFDSTNGDCYIHPGHFIFVDLIWFQCSIFKCFHTKMQRMFL